eukprot:763990-Hanusia_phi.AAC.7
MTPSSSPLSDFFTLQRISQTRTGIARCRCIRGGWRPGGEFTIDDGAQESGKDADKPEVEEVFLPASRETSSDHLVGVVEGPEGSGRCSPKPTEEVEDLASKRPDMLDADVQLDGPAAKKLVSTIQKILQDRLDVDDVGLILNDLGGQDMISIDNVDSIQHDLSGQLWYSPQGGQNNESFIEGVVLLPAEAMLLMPVIELPPVRLRGDAHQSGQQGARGRGGGIVL